MKSKYFKTEELIRCYREKDGRCKGCRLKQKAMMLPNGVDENVEALVEVVLDPAREKLGKAITVNSGFRCPIHNSEVKGAANSQHVKGEAADLTAGSPEENLKLAKLIVKGRNWDQMILEDVKPGSLEPRWIHVSWKRNGVNRREVRKKVAGTGPIYPKLTEDEMKTLV